MPIGMSKTTAGLGGAVPQVNLTGHTRIVQRRLFFSRREIALILEKTIRGGFGNLDLGTVMGVVAGDDRLVPFAAVGNDSTIGKSFLVADAANGQATFQISTEDSYRFQVGDPVVLYNANGGGTYMVSEIAAGGITRGATVATITLGDNFGAATFTVTNGAFVAHRTGLDAADATSLAAAYILDQDVDTGTGGDTIQPNGAMASVVVSNAVLYADVLWNLNAAAITALGLTADPATNPQHYIMR